MANININLDKPQPDPSGGRKAQGAAVDVVPELFRPQGSGKTTTVRFQLKGKSAANCRIVGLRYMNMSTAPSEDLFGEWFVPRNSPPEWNYKNPRWHDPGSQAWIYEPQDQDEDPTCVTLEIERNNSGYVYVVEWEDTKTGERFVCDPKIRNEP